MDRRDIVVVGSSAGGVAALVRICSGLPGDCPAAILIAQHVAPASRSVLPELIRRAGPLPARHPDDGEVIQPGQIYVAPPDLHLLVRPGSLILRRGPYENRTRPAADPLFRSAAISYGPRVIGVVLTGLLDDGTAGLVAIKRCGGMSVVQDPADALWPEMPRNALKNDSPDYSAPVAELPALLARLTSEAAGPKVPIPPNLIREARLSEQELSITETTALLGRPSRLSCPQCGGVLNEVEEKGAVRFRCQIGHALSVDGLMAAHTDELERALEVALRKHRDRLILFRRLERDSSSRGLKHASGRWQEAAAEAEKSIKVLGEAIASMKRQVTPE
jgi:two-component system chemotaxis response regulator CheB